MLICLDESYKYSKIANTDSQNVSSYMNHVQ